MRSLIDQFDDLRLRSESWIGAIAFPAVLYVVSRIILTWTTEVHWILGALSAAIFAGLVGLLLLGLNETLFRKNPARVVLSLFASTVLLAANVCAAWSYILLTRHGAAYEAAVELHPGVFADLYIWHLVDMLPGLKVWETLGVAPPVKSTGVLANLPILVFRLCVILPIFAAIKQWYELARSPKPPQPPPWD